MSSAVEKYYDVSRFVGEPAEWFGGSSINTKARLGALSLGVPGGLIGIAASLTAEEAGGAIKGAQDKAETEAQAAIDAAEAAGDAATAAQKKAAEDARALLEKRRLATQTTYTNQGTLGQAPVNLKTLLGQ